MKHSKHTKLTRRIGGIYHAHEFTLIGAPCGVIRQLVMDIQSLLPDLKIGYIDADHSEADLPRLEGFTDKISYKELRVQALPSDKRMLFEGYDFVFVNGNHFKGDNQIIIINSKKKESLIRKIPRLDNPFLIVFDDEKTLFSELSDVVNESLKSYEIKNTHAIVDAIQLYLSETTPILNGLVLMGGKSMRMGTDKSTIIYHDDEQYAHVEKILNQFCQAVYFSVSSKDDRLLDTIQIKDSFSGLGPYGGLLSAFRSNPNTAWLSCPIDTPDIDRSVVERLVAERDPLRVATCFYNPETDFPEPLITIWEPKAYGHLLNWLGQGYSCPRKVLINSDVKVIKDDEIASKLININTKQEYKEYVSTRKA